MKLLREFLANEVGATSVEYGLAAAIMGVGIITALKGTKTNLGTMFGNAGNNMKPKVVN